MMYTLDRTPDALRHEVFRRVPSPFELTGVFAGETEAVHTHTLKPAASSSTSCPSTGRRTSS
jgi:hypothetical protein